MADLNAIVDQLSGLTVLEAAELSKKLEEKWGVSAAAPVAMAAGPAAGAAAPAADDPLAGMHIVKSPIVGTFYDASSPDAEPYVQVGDTVSVGKVLCIVEAMKLMNEIESDAAGEIVKVFVKPGQPVEYGQALFAVK